MKEDIRKYLHHKKLLDGAKDRVKSLDLKAKDIEQTLIALREKLNVAEEAKKTALRSFVLSEISEAEVEKVKKTFSQVQAQVTDAEEMLSVVKRCCVDLLDEINEPFKGLSEMVKVSEALVWKGIYNETVARLRVLIGNELKRCQAAYIMGGGFHNSIRQGHFLNEVFGNEDISREELETLRQKFVVEYGL